MTTQTAFAAFRKNTPITLDGAAAKFSVDRKTILRWESGESLIPAERLEEVERISGISRRLLRPDLAAIFTEAAE